MPSGLAAVLFGVMPLYSATLAAVALADEPLRARLLAGIAVAIGGLSLAFGESLALGDAKWALLAASACALAPLASAIGNVAIKRRGQRLDPIALNGWAMLGGGALLLAVSAPAEDWAGAAWSAQAIGSVAYLAAIGSAFAFVTLTMLLRELPAVTVSYITLLLPFGALVFGAALYDERDHARRRRRRAAGRGRARDRPVAAPPRRRRLTRGTTPSCIAAATRCSASSRRTCSTTSPRAATSASAAGRCARCRPTRRSARRAP